MRIDEIRAAGRSLARTPAFALSCVLVLAMGIAVATASFGVLKAVVLDSLPYADAERVVEVGARNARLDASGGLTSAEAQAYAAGVPGLAAIGYYTWGGETLQGGDGRPRELTVLRVSAQFAAAIGTPPLLGRPLSAADAEAGERVALVSHREWVRGFGADPGIVGRSLATPDGPLTVVGVMPPGFEYPSPDVALWMPWARANEAESGTPVWLNARFISAIARLAPDADRAAVEAAMERIARGITDTHGLPDTEWRPQLTPAADALLGDQRSVLWGSFVVALLVLAIAGVNAGMLMHARVAARQRELAVAQALGASRARILRGVVLELALLAGAGLLAGLALAWMSLEVWSLALVDALPRGKPAVDAGVFAMACGFAIAVVVLAATLGARERAAPAVALRGGRGLLGYGAGVLRTGPAVAMAMSTIALVTAAAVGLSLLSLLRVDPGWRGQGVHAVQLFRDGDIDAWRAFAPAVIERVRSEPGIVDAAVTTTAPLAVIGSWSVDLELPGRAQAEPYQALLRRVDARYLSLLEIPLRSGRGFTPADRNGTTPVAIVNEALARASFPGENPVGRRIALPLDSGPRIDLEIIGVMADIRNAGPRAPARPEVLLPFDQSPWQGITVLARSTLPREQALAAIERAVWAVAPDEGLTRRYALEDDRAAQMSLVRLLGQVLIVFAVFALALAAFGIHALAAHAQRMRLPEYGLRLALGAQPHALSRAVLVDVLRNAMPGVLVGALGAAGAVALLRSQLFGLGAVWPLAWGAALLATALALLAAGWLPARRAARVDPAQTLRGD